MFIIIVVNSWHTGEFSRGKYGTLDIVYRSTQDQIIVLEKWIIWVAKQLNYICENIDCIGSISVVFRERDQIHKNNS